MDKEILFKIIQYAMDALKFENRRDKHYKISLSLLRYTLQDFSKALEEEE
jgi:hypothetical protein